MRSLCFTTAFLAWVVGCSQPKEIVVYHAASLRRVVADAVAEYQKANPKVQVRLESSGSQVAIRKVTEMNLRADVIAVADAPLIDKMMIPQHAQWNLEFATNEIVLAHMQHSRFTDEVSEKNWPEVLLRPDVRLGRVNPDTAPIGYQAVLVWQLAEKSGLYGPAGEGLVNKLIAAVPKDQIAADETEVLGRLEAKAVDYAFIYRSTAQDHRLKFVALPPEINLGHQNFADKYLTAELEVETKRGAPKERVQGHPITYGLTIPSNAPNAAGAEKFVAFLIGPQGQQIQKAAGFQPTVPALAHPAEKLPSGLKGLAQAGQ